MLKLFLASMDSVLTWFETYARTTASKTDDAIALTLRTVLDEVMRWADSGLPPTQAQIEDLHHQVKSRLSSAGYPLTEEGTPEEPEATPEEE